MSLRLTKKNGEVACIVRSCPQVVGRWDGRWVTLAPGYRRSADDTFRFTGRAVRARRLGHRPERSTGTPNVVNDEADMRQTGLRVCCLPITIACSRPHGQRWTLTPEDFGQSAQESHEHHDAAVIWDVPRAAGGQRRRSTPRL